MKALDHIIEKTMPITRERESNQFTFLIDASVKDGGDLVEFKEFVRSTIPLQLKLYGPDSPSILKSKQLMVLETALPGIPNFKQMTFGNEKLKKAFFTAIVIGYVLTMIIHGDVLLDGNSLRPSKCC